VTTEELITETMPSINSGEAPSFVAGPYAAHFRWLYLWGRRVAEYGFVQCWVQLLTAVAGLMIVRTLAKPDYALYAIANSMQSTCHLLSDVGIGIGVRSIGGRVWSDRRRLGELIKTALDMRRIFALIAIPICIPITAWMLWRNGASTLLNVMLNGILLAGLIPLLSSSVFGVVPQLHGEYRRMQKLDFGNAALRLIMIGGLTLSRMNAWLAASVGAVTNWIELFCNRRWASDHADPTAPPDAEDRRELWRLTRSWMPNVIFFCFQGQVTLLILTLMGTSTEIADISALGRIGAIFVIFSTIFNNVITPRFACCRDNSRLLRLYVGLTLASIAMLVPVVAIAWLYPQPMLWLLGPKYEGLNHECGWVVTAACVTQFCGVLWALNSSKAWIRAQSIAFIPAITTAQLIAAWVLDLREFHNVLIFGLATALAPLPVYFVDAYIGFRRRDLVDTVTTDAARS
jgi:hypothetical protein